MAEDSKGTIISFWLITIFSAVLLYLTTHPLIYILFWASLILSLFSLFFFRDPYRNVPNIPGALISPADGKVIAVNDNANYPGSDEKCIHLAIFLNLHDVHVNRIPIDAEIEKVEYQKGKFLKAFDPDAENLNEQVIIEMKSSRGKLILRQIAGLVARRLVCRLEPGQHVSGGEKFGLMKFSSRIDLYFSRKFNTLVKAGERVRGGETILARCQENEK